jgi:hypothetical protein
MVRLPPNAGDADTNAAAVTFGGLIRLGPYQSNSIIHAAPPDGDHPVGCTCRGSTTPAGDLMTVGQ